MVRRLKYAVTLAVALLFVASLAAAQGDYGGARDARDHGYQHGYRDGLRQGRADLNNNARPSFDSEDYRRVRTWAMRSTWATGTISRAAIVKAIKAVTTTVTTTGPYART